MPVFACVKNVDSLEYLQGSFDFTPHSYPTFISSWTKNLNMKKIVGGIPSHLPRKDDHAWYTMVPLKALSDQQGNLKEVSELNSIKPRRMTIQV